MKSIFFLLVSTLSLLPFVAFSSTFTSDNPIILPTSTINDNDIPLPLPVLDVDGKGVEFGPWYRIMPAISTGLRSGLYLTRLTSDSVCPHGVVYSGPSDGMPVTFSPIFPYPFWPPEKQFVYQTEDLNIMFTPTTKLCANETVWKVADPDITARGLRFVVTGGSIGNPGPETINNWFKIEKMGQPTSPYYKLRYCPTKLCENCPVECKDVGLTRHNGYTRLALTNNPFVVYFKKVGK